MIKIQNRPTVIGSYNFEKQNQIFRYDAGDKLWKTLNAKESLFLKY